MYGMSLGQNKSEKSEKAAHFVPRLMLGFHLRQAGVVGGEGGEGVEALCGTLLRTSAETRIKRV